MNNPQRSLRFVPTKVIWLFAVSLILQVIWHSRGTSPESYIQPLNSPPSVELLRVLSLGDTVVSAKILMLWLQSFDSQRGQFLSYKQLNYIALQAWLEHILQLDPHGQYPLFAASHLYSNVSDGVKQRQILEFVYQQFFADPHHRWPWLAQAAVLAKHRLKDLPLALKYAQAIANHATSSMPLWAQEMQVFILEDLGELEQARLIIGGMLVSGHVTDPSEIKFLNEKLQQLEKKAGEVNK